jgi:hypothetical protein
MSAFGLLPGHAAPKRHETVMKTADDGIRYVEIKQQEHENAENKYANEDSHITLRTFGRHTCPTTVS